MKKISTFKGVLLAIPALVVIAAAALFIYRYQIIQYSTETIIRKLLPDYVSIGRITFDFGKNKIMLSGFRIINPPGFSNKYLLQIEEVSCGYRLRGKNILDGFEVLDPVIKAPKLDIERLASGKVNLIEMQKVMDEAQKKEAGAPAAPRKEAAAAKAGRAGEGQAAASKDKRLSDVVTLPETFLVKAGEMVFTDRLVSPVPRKITFGSVDASLSLIMNKIYTRVLRVSSEGSGNVNGRNSETVKWNVVWDPTTPALTMSNRFEVSGVEIRTFEPYYDRYSPFIFNRGRFSGMLIFDFDNGNIGSSNEVHLADLSFSIKSGQENTQILQTTVPDLAKYFTSTGGDIVFDFKIKGEMAKPQFFLGPISKQAMMSMAIDKVSSVIAEAARAQQGAQAGTGNESEYDKVKDLIDAFKGMAEKK